MATKGGTPHSSDVDNDWIQVQKGNRSGGQSGNDLAAPKQALLGKIGTVVMAPKPLLPITSWHAILNPNPSTSVLNAIDEVQRANLQVYLGETLAETMCSAFG